MELTVDDRGQIGNDILEIYLARIREAGLKHGGISDPLVESEKVLRERWGLGAAAASQPPAPAPAQETPSITAALVKLETGAPVSGIGSVVSVKPVAEPMTVVPDVLKDEIASVPPLAGLRNDVRELPVPAVGIAPAGTAALGEIAVDTIETRRAATSAAAANLPGRGKIVKIITEAPADLGMRAEINNTVSSINHELKKRGLGVIKIGENSLSQEPDERQVLTFQLEATPNATAESCKKAVELMESIMKRQGVKGQIVLYARVNVAEILSKDTECSGVIIVPDAYTDCDAEKGLYPDIVGRMILGRLFAAIKDLDTQDKEGVKNAELRTQILGTISTYLTAISANKVEDLKDARNLADLLKALSSGLRIRPVDYKDFDNFRSSQIATAVSA